MHRSGRASSIACRLLAEEQQVLPESAERAPRLEAPLGTVAPRIGALWGLTITLADYLREDEEAAESFSNIRLTPEQRGALRRLAG